MKDVMATKTRSQRLAFEFYRQSRSRRSMMKSVDVKRASIESYLCKMN
ncbi:hypothetical protein CH06BL_48450 [Chromobacterium haemolyticum]|nr:hypothetical protein CH06BL_48450 [Chromobacterium haemolyticum]